MCDGGAQAKYGRNRICRRSVPGRFQAAHVQTRDRDRSNVRLGCGRRQADKSQYRLTRPNGQIHAVVHVSQRRQDVRGGHRSESGPGDQRRRTRAGRPMTQVVIATARAITPHSQAVYDAGKDELVKSIPVARDFSRSMVTVSTGAIATYIAILKFVLGDKFVPPGAVTLAFGPINVAVSG